MKDESHRSRQPRESDAMSPSKRMARIAGVLYLLVGIFGGFAEGFVEPKMYVAGDAAATALNLVANAGLVRLGVVADLLDQAFFVFTAMALYLLLKHVHKGAAVAMGVFVALAVAIASINTVFLFESLQVVTDRSYFTAFGAAGVDALALLLLDMQHYGLLPRSPTPSATARKPVSAARSSATSASLRVSGAHGPAARKDWNGWPNRRLRGWVMSPRDRYPFHPAYEPLR